MNLFNNNLALSNSHACIPHSLVAHIHAYGHTVSICIRVSLLICMCLSTWIWIIINVCLFNIKFTVLKCFLIFIIMLYEIITDYCYGNLKCI